MKFVQIRDLKNRNESALLAIPYWKKEGAVEPAFTLDLSIPDQLKEMLELGDFKGNEGEVALFYISGQIEKRWCLVGLGEQDKLSVEKLRKGYGALTKLCLAKKFEHISLIVPNIKHLKSDLIVEGVCEGLLLPNYLFHRHKHTESEEEKATLLQTAALISSEKGLEEKANRISTLINAVYYARDLVNENADVVTPHYLGEQAKEMAKTNRALKVSVLNKKAIEEKGLHLLLAVSRGAAVEPALILLDYQGNPASKDKTILVGKGVTYDTGGLNLKPTGSMETMKCDMAGAAACLGVLKAVCDLKMKINVTAVIPTTENAIDANSFKPGDVYSSYCGKTVEMTNSDAEGRLILADALAFATKNFNPSRVIDLATLTGAIEVALGSEAAGIMSTDDELAKQLAEAGDATLERLWRMPLYEDYKERLKSDIADLKSWNGRAAGANVAATFLKQFIEPAIPWAHIDIAATAYLSEPKKYIPKHGTGFGVRLVVKFLEQLKPQK